MRARDFVVERVLKGDATAGSTIKIRYNLGCQSLGDGYYLVLLKNKGDVYEFSRSSGEAEVSEKTCTKYVRSEDTVANLAWEMFNSLQCPSNGVVADALDQLSCLAKNSVFSSSRDKGLPSLRDEIRKAVAPMTRNPNFEIQAMAYKALIANGEEDAIVPALDLLREISPSSEPEGVDHFRAFLLQYELRHVRLMPNMVDAVASRLDTKSLEARRAASYMLRESRQESAIPYLRKLLGDSDFEVRCNAEWGIGMATHAYPYVSAH